MLILASASPRRRELLQTICSDFTVAPSLYEERASGLSAQQTVLLFAEGKAREVLSRFPRALVLGADTVVSLDGRILGKPKSEEEAAEMLRALSGRTHEVFTGVCLAGEGFLRKEVVKTEVTFRTLDEKFIAAYVASGSPMDKAGGYGIQDGDLVASYKGSYSNVVGLPLERVRALLKEGNYVETCD